MIILTQFCPSFHVFNFDRECYFLGCFFFTKLLFCRKCFCQTLKKQHVDNGFLSRALLIAKKLKAKQGRMAESSVDKLAEKV